MVSPFCRGGFPYKGVLDDISERNYDFPFSAWENKEINICLRVMKGLLLINTGKLLYLDIL